MFAIAWFLFTTTTNTCADNVRYFGTLAGFAGHATMIGVGWLASLTCLAVSVRGWWHLVALPLWIFGGVELLILAIYFVRLIAT